MRLRVLYFAALRERLGSAGEAIEFPGEVETCGDAAAWLRARGGVWAEALAEGRNVRAALNWKMAAADTPLEDGAELAFFPPVTGG